VAVAFLSADAPLAFASCPRLLTSSRIVWSSGPAWNSCWVVPDTSDVMPEAAWYSAFAVPAIVCQLLACVV
jgi:hypothetical protein